jgi:hypothetical protein
MTELLLSPDRKSHHETNIGKYSMTGTQYETEAAGEPVWSITIWEPSGSHTSRANHYSVYEGELFNFTGTKSIRTDTPASKVDPTEKETILKAIAEWEAADKEARIKH